MKIVFPFAVRTDLFAISRICFVLPVPFSPKMTPIKAVALLVFFMISADPIKRFFQFAIEVEWDLIIFIDFIISP